MRDHPRITPFCNYSDLIAKVLGRGEDEVRKELGLPLKHKYCLQCGNRLDSQHNYFCDHKCEHEYKWILVSCDGCGKLFTMRAQYLVFYTSTRGQKYFFCNRRCHGNWLGKRYGFNFAKCSVCGVKTSVKKLSFCLKCNPKTIHLLCSYCSGDIYLSPSQFKARSKSHYICCDRECERKYTKKFGTVSGRKRREEECLKGIQ